MVTIILTDNLKTIWNR